MGLQNSNLHKSFQQSSTKIEILNGLSMNIKDGEVVAIVGQSGSGKSTLLSLLAGLDRYDSGEIKIGSQAFHNLDESQLTAFRAKNIGIVFQQFHLMNHLTALENVMLPLEILREENIEERAKEMLGQLGLGHRIDHLPSQLSGGECQRVAIARALVTKPEILLADEPSGNLDFATGESVIDVLFNVVRKHQTTTILVTHSSDLAKRCDRQLVLKNGVV